MNKYNFIVISAQEDFSIETCTLNIFSQVLVLQHQVVAIGFNRSKHTIRRKTTTLTSYSNASQIAFTSHQVLHNAQRLEVWIQHDSHHVVSLFFNKKPQKLQKMFDYLYHPQLHIFSVEGGFQLQKGQTF
jgi:hypothetical protein